MSEEQIKMYERLGLNVYTTRKCSLPSQSKLGDWIVFRAGEVANLVYELRTRAESAENERDELERQELHGMDCTIDQMLSLEMREKWGLDKQEHGRNIQLMFCRALNAINELEDENERLKAENLAMRCCGNCASRNGHADCDCDLDNDDTIECYSENYKNWKSKAVKND